MSERIPMADLVATWREATALPVEDVVAAGPIIRAGDDLAAALEARDRRIAELEAEVAMLVAHCAEMDPLVDEAMQGRARIAELEAGLREMVTMTIGAKNSDVVLINKARDFLSGRATGGEG